jgi:AcrR family transcriptional regulator
MQRRAVLVDETHRRIRDAAIRLHTTVGPAAASIAAVAQEAGVTRLTVYRHYPTLEELFVACRGHWRDTHQPPDPALWREVDDAAVRARLAFGELYRWFEANADELYPINRDEQAMPVATQATIRRERTALADAIVGDEPGTDRRTRRAVAGLLVTFLTWRSLVIDQGLTTDEAIELAVRIVERASPAPRA